MIKKSGKTYKYKEEDHSRQLLGHDKLTDSRVIEASSREEAQKIFNEALVNDHTYEEYSAAARVQLENVQFVDDPIVESQITSSNPANMPLRQAGYLKYNLQSKKPNIY